MVKKLKPEKEKELVTTIQGLEKQLQEMQKKTSPTKKTENILDILVDMGHIASRLKTLIRIKTKYLGK